MMIPQTFRTILDLHKPEVYHRQRHALIRYYEWNGGSDPGDLADEVIRRLLESDATIGNCAAFVQGIAQNVLFEHWRGLQRERSIAFHLQHETVSVVTEALTQDLEGCLNGLSNRNRSLILGFYGYEPGDKAIHRKQLAKRFGLSDNGLRVRVSRIRTILAQCLATKHASSSE